MGTYTTKYDVYKPETTDFVEEELLNEGLDNLDNFLVLQNVTSGARPANPFTRQMIFETDTKRVVVWTGTYWNIITQQPLCILEIPTDHTGLQNNVGNILNFTSVVFDNDNMADTTNKRIIVRKKGIYLAIAHTRCDTPQAGFSIAGNIRVNGIVETQDAHWVTSTAMATHNQMICMMPMNVNDYFEVTFYHNEAANDQTVSALGSRFIVMYMGGLV